MPVVSVLVFRKNNSTPQHGQRRTKFQHMGRKISDSEVVPETAKAEQKYEKQQRKTSLRVVCEKLRRKLKIKVIVKTNRPPKIFHGLHSYRL